MKPFPVSIDPDIVSGEPRFDGTRVMIRTLIDHLIGDYSIEEYLEQYPSVEPEQVETFLEIATTLMTQVRP